MKKKSMMENLKSERYNGKIAFADASVEGRTYGQLETMENGLRQHRDAILMTRGGIGLGLFLIAFLTFAMSLALRGLTGFTFGVLAVSLIIAILTTIDIVRVFLISGFVLDRIAKERDSRVKEILRVTGREDTE